MTPEDTLSGWGNKDKIAYFLARADTIIPRRREQLELVADLLPFADGEPVAILDLGAGFGAVTDQLIARWPAATVTCVDGSPEMMRLAGERLPARYGERVRLRFGDLAYPTWRDGLAGPFDAAVSVLAIHHVSDPRKRALYREVFELLKPGGIFLNDDPVVQPPALRDRFEHLQLRVVQAQERAQTGVTRPLDLIQAEMREQLRLAGERHQSHIAGLSDQLGWLREAGFTSVDCYWKFFDLALFGGVRP